MSAIQLQEIDYTHPVYYNEVWYLREAVLRQPIGLSLKNEDLSMDKEDSIIIALHNNAVIGCIMMHPLANGAVKLRQMAVYPEWQGKNIGKQIMDYALAIAIKKSYTRIVFHARMTAVGFYQKLGYNVTSNVFEEVGIPHVVMEKLL